MLLAYFPQLLLNGIIAGATYGVVALGYGMVYGTLKFPNFTHGTIAMVGAFTVYWLSVEPFHLPLFVAIPLSLVSTAGLGIGVEFIAYRTLRGRSKFATVVSTIAVALMLEAIVVFFTQGRFMFYDVPIGRGIQIGSVSITPVQIIIIVTSVALMLAMRALLAYTKLGKAMRAVSNNLSLAEACGIHSGYVIQWIFAIGAMLAASAGILYGMDRCLMSSMGMSMTIKSFAAVILGGLGSVEGSVIGGLLLGLGENLGVVVLEPKWKDAIAFAVMTVGLYIKPTGFFGKAEDMVLHE